MAKPGELTEKQRRFVEAYVGAACGNATEAARLAGYSGNDVTLATTGSENLRRPPIAAAIAAASKPIRKAAIMDQAERQELLTQIAKSAEEETRDRLRSVELLGKMQGDFIERSVVEVKAADAMRSQLERLRKLMSPAAFDELLRSLASDTPA